MQNVLATAPVPSSEPFQFSHAPAAQSWGKARVTQCHDDHAFIGMLNAYRNSGGMAREQEVAALLARHAAQDGPTFADWIVEGRVIHFEWQSQIWFPLFQFQLSDMTFQPALAEFFTALICDCDSWALAQWFAQVNPLLIGRTPADAVLHDLPAVLRAARAAGLIPQG